MAIAIRRAIFLLIDAVLRRFKPFARMGEMHTFRTSRFDRP
jgi:hypothetical protein